MVTVGVMACDNSRGRGLEYDSSRDKRSMAGKHAGMLHLISHRGHHGSGKHHRDPDVTRIIMEG